MVFNEKDFFLYTKKLDFAALKVGDHLPHDVYSTDGAMIAKAGSILSEDLLGKLDKVKYKLVTIDVSRLYQQTLSTYKVVMQRIKEGEVPDKKVIAELITPFVGETESKRNAADFLGYLQGKGEYLIQHSIQVGVLAMFLARWREFPEQEILEVAVAGTIHDIGKYRVADEILNKPGPLNKREMAEVKKHSLYGYELLKDAEDFSDDIKLGVLQHHEREDGSGYPQGLQDGEIHPYAKILAIVDVFQAMITDKVYSKKVNPFYALDFLLKSISQFDTEMVFTFTNKMLDYYAGGRVVLNTGENGTVVYINKDYIRHPMVQKDDGTIVDLKKDRNTWIVSMLDR